MADINDKLKRAIDGPAPQHKLPGRDVFEPSEGSDGALHTKVTDVEGNPIDPRDVKLPSNYPDSATLAELQAIKEENTEIKKTQGKIIEALQANNENLMNTNQVLESVIKDNRIQSDAQVTGSIVGYSTEDKTVIFPNAKRNDQFLELDTKDVYFHDGKGWVKW